MDIVIVNNRITEVRSAGTPGVPLEPNRQPRDATTRSTRRGMWVMPGLVDEHVHAEQGGNAATYAYKLWLAHGVTTVRGVTLFGNAAASATRPRASATRSSRRGSTTTSGRAAAGPTARSTRRRRRRDWVTWGR